MHQATYVSAREIIMHQATYVLARDISIHWATYVLAREIIIHQATYVLAREIIMHQATYVLASEVIMHQATYVLAREILVFFSQIQGHNSIKRKSDLACLLWSLTLCINSKCFAYAVITDGQTWVNLNSPDAQRTKASKYIYMWNNSYGVQLVCYQICWQRTIQGLSLPSLILIG